MYRVNNLLFVHTIFACIFGVKLKIFPGATPPNPPFFLGAAPPDPLLCHLENPFQNSWLRHCVYVTGFAKTVLKGTFCISRNTNLKY